MSLHLKNRLDFSTRVFIYLFAAMLAVFAVYNFIFFHIHKKSQEDAIIQDGSLLCRMLAENFRLAVFSEDRHQLDLIARTIMPLEGIALIRVYNSDGHLIYQSDSREKDQDNKAVIPLGLAGTSRPIYYDSGNKLKFWTPVRGKSFTDIDIFFTDDSRPAPARILGYINMDMNKSSGRREIKNFIFGELVAAIFFIFVSGFLSFIIARSAAAPLKQLLKKVQGETAPGGSYDEFGLLTRAYNDLIQRLGDSFATVDEFNRSLEEEVNLRTEELKQANTRMQTTMIELKESQAQVIQAEKMAALGLLVAGVAHEINNTINFISGALPPLEKNLEALKTRLNHDSDNDAAGICENLTTLMDNIREGAKRTSEIVRNLQEFSRPHPREFKLSSPRRIINTTLNLMRPKFKDRIEISTKYQEPETEIPCYPGQLGQVFMNIILNSVQAIEGQGRIVVSTTSNAGFYRIKIADDGPGISPETGTRIFDPFFTTKAVGHGTGLGLSVSYSIIKKHDGEIRLNPSPFGHGCEFEIILPVKNDREGSRQ